MSTVGREQHQLRNVSKYNDVDVTQPQNPRMMVARRIAAIVEDTLAMIMVAVIRGIKDESLGGRALHPRTMTEGDTEAIAVTLTETAMQMMLHANGGIDIVRDHGTARAIGTIARARRIPRSADAPTAHRHHHLLQSDLELL